jgi:hypothetical protein
MGLGYGVDTYCGASLQTGRLVGGRLKFGLDCFRRLRTPKSTLRGISDEDEEADYGLDLAGFVGATDSRDLRGAIGPAIRTELMDDNRVRDVAARVVATSTADGLAYYTIEVRIMPVDEDTELTLTIGVSSVTVDLLGVSA